MKILVQFMIIVVVTLVGEAMAFFINIPIPGPIYAFVLMFLCLLFGIIKIEQVREAGKFLVLILPIMFIAPAAAILEESDIADVLIRVIVIAVVTTIAVMAATGYTAQYIVRRQKRRNGEELEGE
ncbi:MAG: CidA/LrgA family protein [Oscillospiraceae bacterium]|nr:CidA/LrgA family protein [Oscillospiraceae bacterium]